MLELAFATVLANMDLPETCKPRMPELRCMELTRLYGPRARGMYPRQGKIIYLDKSVCHDRAFAQHEITHYLQWACGLPQDETEAYRMQYK